MNGFNYNQVVLYELKRAFEYAHYEYYNVKKSSSVKTMMKSLEKAISMIGNTPLLSIDEMFVWEFDDYAMQIIEKVMLTPVQELSFLDDMHAFHQKKCRECQDLMMEIFEMKNFLSSLPKKNKGLSVLKKQIKTKEIILDKLILPKICS